MVCFNYFINCPFDSPGVIASLERPLFAAGKEGISFVSFSLLSLPSGKVWGELIMLLMTLC
jgi:hypothetical protein